MYTTKRSSACYVEYSCFQKHRPILKTEQDGVGGMTLTATSNECYTLLTNKGCHRLSGYR